MGAFGTRQADSSAGGRSRTAVLGRPARRRVVIVLLALGAGVGVLAMLVAAVSGSDRERGGGPVAWADEPRILTPSALPNDRVLSGRIRNDSLRRVRIEAREVRIEAVGGERVVGTATFAASFLHGLYPPTREPQEIPESELRRLGRLAVMEPGESLPLTLAWRLEEGRPGPVRVNYGRGSLPIPR